jgi:hypothetical protein
MKKIVYYISQIFMIFLGSNQRVILNTGVKSHGEICILKRSRQGGKLNTFVKAEVKFVYPKFEFEGG